VDLPTITEDCLELIITRVHLVPQGYNMVVTPKEIDELVENMSNIVARGINFAVN